MLLLVFVHGFLGSEESFESFPFDLESFMNNLSCPCESKIYPKYDTKGNNQRQVIALVDWLLLNATTVQYSQVVLLAHSMGGLLAVDAYRHLYSDSTVRGLVNVRGIISLDSPFFGIVPSVLTDINNIPQNFVSKSIESLSTAMGSSMNTPAGWAQMILTTAAVGTSLMTMPRTAINGIAVKAAEHVRNHLEFLYPLAESSLIISERMKILEKEFDEQRLFFRGFHVQLKKPSQDGEFYFCKLPPTEYRHFFTPLSSPCSEEVKAHMSLFDASYKQEYQELLEQISTILLVIHNYSFLS